MHFHRCLESIVASHRGLQLTKGSRLPFSLPQPRLFGVTIRGSVHPSPSAPSRSARANFTPAQGADAGMQGTLAVHLACSAVCLWMPLINGTLTNRNGGLELSGENLNTFRLLSGVYTHTPSHRHQTSSLIRAGWEHPKTRW